MMNLKGEKPGTGTQKEKELDEDAVM